LVSTADLLFQDADVLVSGVFIVADGGQTLGQDYDRVSLHDEPLRSLFREVVEVFSVELVGNAGRAVVDDLHIIEDLGFVNVRKGDRGKTSAQTDAGNVQLLQACLLSDGNEIAGNIVDDGVPHLLVGLLNFAVGADVAVDDLVGIEDVLPDVEEGVGVSESEHDKLGVNTQHALDVLFVLFDVVGVEGPVGTVADVAVPQR
jgi:hypothetical protein